MTGNAIRAYLRELRARRRMTQQQVADGIGVSVLSWKKYERGKTEDPQSSFLLRAVQVLNGSFDHLRELADECATEEDGRRLAEQRLIEEAGGNVGALRQRMSAAEFDRFVDDLQRALSQHVSDIPRLAEVLRRYRIPPPTDQQPD